MKYPCEATCVTDKSRTYWVVVSTVLLGVLAEGETPFDAIVAFNTAEENYLMKCSKLGWPIPALVPFDGRVVIKGICVPEKRCYNCAYAIDDVVVKTKEPCCTCDDYLCNWRPKYKQEEPK